MEKLVIFDTTLRDGEQAPGASLHPNEKLEIALLLEQLKVDVIEAGFPIASKGDFEAVSLISKKIKKCIICGLARAKKEDIQICAQSLKKAKHPRIHVFLATSEIHRKFKLKKAKEEILKIAGWATEFARNLTDDVEFSPEDASRTEEDFLLKVIEEVIKKGAKTVNIPDTVGWAYPEQFGRLIENILNKVPNINKAIISVHCHNDLGLAVANSLAAIKAGARQVHCTINGIGERAGNASLEEVVMGIKTRRDIFPEINVGINTPLLYKASRLVSRLTGFVVAPNKAIVGKNAFRHEAGIHQDGILKDR
ncbi:MAG: 2-isopropylmalate synthase, partial [Candidatus Omnitrophica bacterium 4484_70.2]